MCQELGDWPQDSFVSAAQRSLNTAKQGSDEQGDRLTVLIETNSKFCWFFFKPRLKRQHLEDEHRSEDKPSACEDPEGKKYH